MLKPGARIYFLAICGTGMSALAGLLKEKGFVVAGSDVAAYPPVGPLLRSLQIPVHLGFDVSDLQAFSPDYVVIGNFIRRDNAQAQYVLENKIPYGSFPSTLEDLFLQETKNIVVVGTHGKTTTTACASFLLSAAEKDPSFLIGGLPLNFNQSFHVGKGSSFVIEGDEYDTAFFDKESKFLHYKPFVGVFNSLEYDHADIFPTMESMEKMFRKFLSLLPQEGILFYCRDWERVHEIVREEKKSSNLVSQVRSYGFHPESDARIQNFKEDAEGIDFEFEGIHIRNSMNGVFNAQNFAAAGLSAQFMGLSWSQIEKALPQFLGVKRRQEVIGKIGEHLVIDDFAHHPTAVERVLEGLRKKYPHHKLVTFFEPRSNTSRRNIFQAEYERAFRASDLTFMAEVFKKEALTTEALDVQKIQEAHRKLGKEFFSALQTDEMLSKASHFAKNQACVFVILSNGAFDGLHSRLISQLKLL